MSLPRAQQLREFSEDQEGSAAASGGAADDDDDGDDGDESGGGGWGDFPGPHCVPRGGMDTLFAGLWDGRDDGGGDGEGGGARRRTRLGTTVSAIEWARSRNCHARDDPLDPALPGRVLIRTAGGACYGAEAVVITVPLGVLQAGRPAFVPRLPAQKRAAIARLRMGAYKKVSRVSRRPVARETVFRFEYRVP